MRASQVTLFEWVVRHPLMWDTDAGFGSDRPCGCVFIGQGSLTSGEANPGQVICDEWQAVDGGCRISCFLQESVCAGTSFLTTIQHQQPTHPCNPCIWPTPCNRAPSDSQWPLISDPIIDPDQGFISNLGQMSKNHDQ